MKEQYRKGRRDSLIGMGISGFLLLASLIGAALYLHNNFADIESSLNTFSGISKMIRIADDIEQQSLQIQEEIDRLKKYDQNSDFNLALETTSALALNLKELNTNLKSINISQLKRFNIYAVITSNLIRIGVLVLIIIASRICFQAYSYNHRMVNVYRLLQSQADLAKSSEDIKVIFPAVVEASEVRRKNMGKMTLDLINKTSDLLAKVRSATG